MLGATSGFGAERGTALSLYKILTNIIDEETKKKD
jgi:hypothetical protein